MTVPYTSSCGVWEKDCRFIVNPLSGGRRGAALLRTLQRRFGPERVLDILASTPDRLVASDAGGPSCLVVAGGDGTVASVLDILYTRDCHLPVAVMPLGTGNDLARALGWGPAFLGDLDQWLQRLDSARPRGLDRGRLQWDGGSRSWYNYCSIGQDARITTAFDTLRRQHDWFFRTRLINRGLYGFLGGTLVPGGAAPMRRGAESLIVANVPSYAGGLDLGSQVLIDDGRVDLFGLPTGVTQGLVMAGLRKPRRVAQVAALVAELPHASVWQVDGEPLRLPPGKIRIGIQGRVTVLEPRSVPDEPRTNPPDRAGTKEGP